VKWPQRMKLLDLLVGAHKLVKMLQKEALHQLLHGIEEAALKFSLLLYPLFLIPLSLIPLSPQLSFGKPFSLILSLLHCNCILSFAGDSDLPRCGYLDLTRTTMSTSLSPFPI